MIEFSHPGFLYAGVAVVVVVTIAFANRARRSRRLAVFLGGSRAARRLSRRDLFRLKLERIALLASAALCVAAGAAGPRWTALLEAPESSVPGEASAVMVALDVSSSMQDTDVSPTRLGAAVGIARELVASLEGSEVGLLLVAGKAYTLTPPTRDHRGLLYLLEGVTPTTVTPWDPGSRLSAGILEGMAQLSAAGAGAETRIVLISDAEVVEPAVEAIEAARAAATRGIEVHTVGVRSDRGTARVAPELGEPLLRRLAETGGGTYRDGTSLSAVVGGPRGFGSVAEPAGRAAPWSGTDLAFWLGAAALLLVLMDGLLDGQVRRGRRELGASAP